MRKLKFVIVFSVILAAIIVFSALHFRQQARRTGQDAYIPIRSLSPYEAAALLLAEDGRDPTEHMGTIIQSVSEQSVTLLTREYVIETGETNQSVPESHGVVQVRGKKYYLVANSWENYVCSYRILRKLLEQIINRQLSPTSQTDILRSDFQEAKISFSSDWIWLYIIVEIILVSCILILVYCIVTKTHFLLWLPSFAALALLMAFIVRFYSPAFLDADWFHQRIIIEDIALLSFFPFAVSGPIGDYLTVLSLCIFVLYRTGKMLAKKNIIKHRVYVRLILVIASLVLTYGLVVQYLQYAKASKNARRMISAVQQVLSSTKTSSIVETFKYKTFKHNGTVTQVNIFEKGILSDDTMNYVSSILSVRSKGDPELRVLIPVEQQYFFLNKNDGFSNGGLRTLKYDQNEITDYEYIEPAINSKKHFRMSFWRYLNNVVQKEFTRYIEIAIIKDEKGLLSSVVIATFYQGH